MNENLDQKKPDRSFRRLWTVAIAVVTFASSASYAFGLGGKLALTGGVSQVEGSAGGGLTPWAVIAGGETDDQVVGATVYDSNVSVQNFGLSSMGAALGFFNRVEVSYARQSFNTRDVGVALGAGSDYYLNQDIFGLKVRLYGDAVLDQDSWIPQIAVGAQYKRNNQGSVPEIGLIGAVSDTGVDYYLAFTKIFLNQSIVANLTIRETKANQMGLLGFGGPNNSNYQTMLEASLGYLLCRHLLVGGEYRQKPNNLAGDALNIQESSYEDLFLAWAASKNISLTLAYVWLGQIAIEPNQNGTYASVQVGF